MDSLPRKDPLKAVHREDKIKESEISKCLCCGLSRLRTSWDLRLGTEPWTTNLDEIKKAANKGCQDCELILNAVLTQISPKTHLDMTQIRIRLYPHHGLLGLDITPRSWSSEPAAELEVLRIAGALYIFLFQYVDRDVTCSCLPSEIILSMIEPLHRFRLTLFEEKYPLHPERTIHQNQYPSVWDIRSKCPPSGDTSSETTLRLLKKLDRHLHRVPRILSEDLT